MSDIIQLSSDNEENKEKPTKRKLKRIGTIRQVGKGPEDVEENLTSYKKEKPAKALMKHKGSVRQENRDCDGVTGESWSTFQKFLKICYNIELLKRKGDSKSMTVILDKLSHRFKNADTQYTQSDAFIEAVKSAENLVESDPSNLFVHMKQVGDELKLRSCKSKNNNHKRKVIGEEDIPPKKRTKTSASDGSEEEKQEQEKPVNQMHCKKLEKIFEKVYRKVKKLEEKEVDWDEDGDSAYIRLERYKKRLCAVWEKWQEVSGREEEVKKLKHRKIAFSGTRYPELDHAIERFVNKTKCFPDFMDIYKLTSKTLTKDKELDLGADQLKSIASAAFQILGNQLQKVRVFDFWNCCMSYLPSTSDSTEEICDPADQNEDLSRALKENKQNYSKKLSDVIDSFVVKQVDEKHEPEEVILGTDDEGSVPSGDDEEEEEEDENPEDIICISSSSSEDSGGETKTDMKQPRNGRDKHSSNENLTEPENKMKSGDKSDSEHADDYIPLRVKNEGKVRVELGNLKKEAGEVSVKMESFASCSNSSRKKKIKEVILLSESDSGE